MLAHFMVSDDQLVLAPVCETGTGGIKTHRSPQFFLDISVHCDIIMGYLNKRIYIMATGKCSPAEWCYTCENWRRNLTELDAAQSGFCREHDRDTHGSKDCTEWKYASMDILKRNILEYHPRQKRISIPIGVL